MGFPVGYSELPKLLLHFLFILSHLRRLATWLLSTLGLDPSPLYCPDTVPHHLLSESNGPYYPIPPSSLEHFYAQLPVIPFADLSSERGAHMPDGCAVCLHDFEGSEEVRRPVGCCHVFHRCCLDRWAAYGRSTCPLCRAPLVTDGFFAQ